MPIQLDLSNVAQPLVGLFSALAQAQNSAKKLAPTPATVPNAPDDTSPPVLPHPDDLSRFLLYAATNYGVSREGLRLHYRQIRLDPM